MRRNKHHGGFALSVPVCLMIFVGHAYAQGTWTTKAPMPTPLAGSVAGVINGQLYVMGGTNPAPAMAYEAYNPATDTWATTASAPTPRSQAGAAVINNKLYVVGGCINSDCIPGNTNLLESYDPASNSWASLAPMPTARSYTAVGAINGKLYVAGGYQQCGPCTPLTTLEVYDPSTNTWDSTKRPMPVAQTELAGAVVKAAKGLNRRAAKRWPWMQIAGLGHRW